jgi:NADPH2:quinone reductase
MRQADVPDPEPGPGEALLRVHYAALNPADAYLAEGQYPARPTMPHILGRDGSGEVIGLGSAVEGIQLGQKKAILRGDAGVSRWGTFAERVVVPAECLVDIPVGWTAEQGSSAALVYLTAYQALTQWEDLPEKAVVLISGASGGVGVAATHLAVAMGYTVTGLSRSADKRRSLESLGMSHVLDPADPKWRAGLGAFLGKRKVDLAIDSVGGALFPELIATLGDRGRVSVVGRLAGEVPRFNTATLLFRRIRIGGVTVGAYAGPESRKVWARIVDLLNKTGARPVVDQVYPFNDLPAAFARLAAGPLGKVLLRGIS